MSPRHQDTKTPELIVALDVESRAQAMRWVKLLYPKVRIFKVGLQLYTACGPGIIQDIRRIGAEVFLDLKFNDIPNTMASAAREARKLKVAMLTVHTLSGPIALKEVAQACRGGKTKVLGVTILTSICQHFLNDLKIQRSLGAEALYLAKMAKRCGLDGVVCPAKEASPMRKHLGKNFIIVSPGIRPKNYPADDQKRKATATEAAIAGANYIVVGRPILKAPNPRKAAEEIIAECKE
jgi:orotidine-5'-phosphate decarboxylase